MTKLALRFFVICIIITLIVSGLILYLDNLLIAENTQKIAENNAKGKYQSLYEYLKNYPTQDWPAILKKIQPQGGSTIQILPIAKLPLSKKQIRDIEDNKLVYITQEMEKFGAMETYKKMGDTPYVFKETTGFTDSEVAHRFFAWPPMLITMKLREIPQSKWNDYLKIISSHYGYPISALELSDPQINEAQRKKLRKNTWIVDWPNKKDRSLEIVYIPILKDKVLKFGPIHYLFIDTYHSHILIFAAFIAIEIIIFLFIFLFSTTLDKLKNLAHEYGRGNFSSQIQIKSSSTLFPLFNNLKNMGNNIRRLITSHKELTNSVAHEFRTPLSRLRFSLQLLKESKNLGDVAVRADTMEEDIAELEELVSEILTYAKLDRIEPSLEFKPLSLKRLIMITEKKASRTLDNKKLITYFANNNDPIIINAHAKYILRALQNLVQNAIRHTRSIVKINVIKDDNNHYQISIEDNGPGIAHEDRARVFSPFVQLSRENKRAPGYGLGLAITKKIIDWHHWDITIADSDLGGAKFIITI